MWQEESTHVHFTPREEQVAELLLGGLSNREIGAALGIQEHPVKCHVRHMLKKTGTSNRVELAIKLMDEQNDEDVPVMKVKSLKEIFAGKPKALRMIELVRQGKENKEIGKEFGMNLQLVKNYLREIYIKLGLSDRLELALRANAEQHWERNSEDLRSSKSQSDANLAASVI